MDLVRPFYDDGETQQYYAERVELLIKEVENIYGKNFKLNVFLPKVQELARCEIAIRHYSKLIANGQDKKDTKQMLRDERTREHNLWSHLGLSMSLIEKSAKDHHTEDSDNFEEHLDAMISEAQKEGDLNLDDLDDDDTVHIVDVGPAGVTEENAPVPCKPADIHEVKVKDIKEIVKKGEAEDAG